LLSEKVNHIDQFTSLEARLLPEVRNNFRKNWKFKHYLKSTVKHFYFQSKVISFVFFFLMMLASISRHHG